MLLVEVHLNVASVQKWVAGSCIINNVKLLCGTNHVEELVTDLLVILLVILKSLHSVGGYHSYFKEKDFLKTQILKHIRCEFRLINEPSYLILTLICERIINLNCCLRHVLSCCLCFSFCCRSFRILSLFGLGRSILPAVNNRKMRLFFRLTNKKV